MLYKVLFYLMQQFCLEKDVLPFIAIVKVADKKMRDYCS